MLCCYSLQVLRLGSPSVLPNGDITWVEMRPFEQGRSVLIHRQVALQSQLTSTSFAVHMHGFLC